jgi:hypothetical protein
MSFKSDFIRAIHEKKLVSITADTLESGRFQRICVPLEFGPSGRPRDGIDRFHFWDLNSPHGAHKLILSPSELLDLEVLPESFDPKDYARGNTVSTLHQGWGKTS